MRRPRRLLTAAVMSVALAALSAAPAVSPAAASQNSTAVLKEYAADTWRSMAAMVDPRTGLVADNVGGDLAPGSRAGYTSPTNIGAYFWSTVTARATGLVSPDEAKRRIARTLRTLSGMETHQPSGMFFNWYDPATGVKLTTWPADGSTVHPFLSSVDNAWLATGLQVVADQVPALSDQAHAVLDRMDFGYYYDAAVKQIRGGFWLEPQPGSVPGNYRGGDTVYYTGHHYGAFNTEPRMASYLGIASEQIPQKHYFGTWRTFPSENCDWSWSEQSAVGHYVTYLGQNVFEGAYQYRGMKLIPTWGGSM